MIRNLSLSRVRTESVRCCLALSNCFISLVIFFTYITHVTHTHTHTQSSTHTENETITVVYVTDSEKQIAVQSEMIECVIIIIIYHVFRVFSFFFYILYSSKQFLNGLLGLRMYIYSVIYTSLHHTHTHTHTYLFKSITTVVTNVSLSSDHCPNLIVQSSHFNSHTSHCLINTCQ